MQKLFACIAAGVQRHGHARIAHTNVSPRMCRMTTGLFLSSSIPLMLDPPDHIAERELDDPLKVRVQCMSHANLPCLHWLL